MVAANGRHLVDLVVDPVDVNLVVDLVDVSLNVDRVDVDIDKRKIADFPKMTNCVLLRKEFLARTSLQKQTV